MSKKKRDFVIISHCLLNPHCRVHILGKNFTLPKQICSYLLSHNVAIIQLPCPEFQIMGYWRNPQGKQQYNNTFFINSTKKLLEKVFMEIEELTKNNHQILAFIGVQGSPTCSVYWGKHKKNKYNTESIIELTEDSNDHCFELGVMTNIISNYFVHSNLSIPLLEAPIRECLNSERNYIFWSRLKSIVERCEYTIEPPKSPKLILK